MLSILVSIIVTLLIVGLLLWAVDQMPFISADVKRMIHIFVVVVAALWLLGVFFPGVTPVHVR